MVVDGDFSACRLHEGDKNPHQTRFPGPVGTDHRHLSSLRDGQSDAVERDSLAVTDTHLPQFEQVDHGSPAASPVSGTLAVLAFLRSSIAPRTG